MALYEAPDKPADPLCFLRNNFAGQNIEELQETVKKLTAEKEKLLVDVETLSKENSELKDKLAAAEKTAQQAVEANGSPATDEPEVKEPEPEVSSKDEEAMETDAKDLPEAVEKTEPVDEGEAKAEDQPKAPAAAPAAAAAEADEGKVEAAAEPSAAAEK